MQIPRKTYLQDDACLLEAYLQDDAIFKVYSKPQKPDRKTMHFCGNDRKKFANNAYLQDDACFLEAYLQDDACRVEASKN